MHVSNELYRIIYHNDVFAAYDSCCIGHIDLLLFHVTYFLALYFLNLRSPTHTGQSCVGFLNNVINQKEIVTAEVYKSFSY